MPLNIPRNQILGITMPGFGTTDRTYNNACDLIRSLGVTLKEISIKDACLQHFKDISHNPSVHDVTYENSQARERTQILMDVANQENGMVIGTGDLSELALGWATYNGDHMSMYGVNGSIPKTLVKYLVEWVAHNRVDEASRAHIAGYRRHSISPELIPADEKTETSNENGRPRRPVRTARLLPLPFPAFRLLPPRFILWHNRLSAAIMTKRPSGNGFTFFRRFFQQQFKRSCLPDGRK